MRGRRLLFREIAFITHPTVHPREQVAAALPAAVTSTNLQGTAPPFRRNHLCRSPYPNRQLLFGRGGLGERRFS